MRPLSEMTIEDIDGLKMVVFDVDGVLVPRGTKIRRDGNVTSLETKVIAKKQIEQIRELQALGLLVNISSGRGLYMLQEMFRDILPLVSLTYENGSATWHKGKIHQHINSFDHIYRAVPKLRGIDDMRIKGFEPKEFIVTIHCHGRVEAIEEAIAAEKGLYFVWSGEAYDIGVKGSQTKGIGLVETAGIFGLDPDEVMAIGDNYNDIEMLGACGMPISADKDKVEGMFYTSKEAGVLPAEQLMDKLVSLFSDINGRMTGKSRESARQV